MNKSLFIAVDDNLIKPPKGPLRRIKPARLFSLAALRQGWLKVQANGGGGGVDGVSVTHFEAELDTHLTELRADLLSGRYRPQKVRRILVPKASGGMRPIGLWTLRDRVAQRVVTDCITPYFERTFLPNSFGFRTGLGVRDAVKAVVVQREANRRWVADVDIKRCFDHLDPKLLMTFVRQQVKDRFVLYLIQSWLKAQVLNDMKGPNTPAAISQGSVISPLLANVYLHQLDLQLTKQGLHFIRYADDAIICCRRKQEAEAAMHHFAQALQPLKLTLNPHKSQVVHFDQGFQFLGVFFLRNEHFNLSSRK